MRILILLLFSINAFSQIQLNDGKQIEGRIIQNFGDSVLIAAWLPFNDAQHKFWYVNSDLLAAPVKKKVNHWGAAADRYTGTRLVIGGLVTQMISTAIFTPLYVKRQDKTYIGLASGLGAGAILELAGVIKFRKAAVKDFAKPYEY